jgi:hypothetical protein
MGLGYSDKIPISKGLLLNLIKYLATSKKIYVMHLVDELEQELKDVEED